MSSKENNSEVAVEKATENNDKPNNDAKAEVKGTKRPAEVEQRHPLRREPEALRDAHARPTTYGLHSMEHLITPSLSLSALLVYIHDKTEDVKKSKKEEENGEGDNFEEILDEEEEELEGEEDEEDNLSEADEMGDDLGEGEVSGPLYQLSVIQKSLTDLLATNFSETQPMRIHPKITLKLVAWFRTYKSKIATSYPSTFSTTWYIVDFLTCPLRDTEPSGASTSCHPPERSGGTNVSKRRGRWSKGEGVPDEKRTGEGRRSGRERKRTNDGPGGG
ncbi:unnamed protein product [Nesidiocoris tenuis]|uniref:Uncharacterized protein n=1 Tax=Nesidiocoris tenuis TaxID=355587 RepID=A0A6H5G9M3_9HEMI|nr:unnamed protein product [Nesidiocoris tenuis]